MADNPAIQAWKAFLESTPPNTSKEISALAIKESNTRGYYYSLPKIRLQLHCQVDGGVRWFDWSNGDPVLRSTWEPDAVRGDAAADLGAPGATG